MNVLRHAVRSGVYHDSIVLMQLRAALEEEPGVLEAGAVMGTRENLGLLEAAGILPELPEEPGSSDLLVVVRAESAEAASAALAGVDRLLERDRSGDAEGYRPRSLSAAVRLLPAARWVLVSVPGRFAADVAGEALELGRHVFLFSDNVPLEREVELKRRAGSRGLLVMGPDCGTAMLGGIGLGFANRVRRGPVGIVAASGTGLQAVACGIDALGGGVSHAIGTGGRDLSAAVGGTTALQALDLLSRDPETRAIVLVSKPPDRAVAGRMLAAAEGLAKPVVACFLGDRRASAPRAPGASRLLFARSLDHAAALAVECCGIGAARPPVSGPRAAVSTPTAPERPASGYLRGLFAGGTLAHEALAAAACFLEPGSLHANLAAPGIGRLADPWSSRDHTVLDLGADAFTAGRPHPMLDQELRIRRLAEEAADPEVGLLLLDVVLGDGVHRDPAAELAPAIETARAGRAIEVVVILIGTDHDPQDLRDQASRLARAGARVFRGVDEAMAHVRSCLADRPGDRELEPPGDEGPAEMPEADRRAEEPADGPAVGSAPHVVPLDLEALRAPVAAINVGVEAFHRSLIEREVRSIHVEWRPPAAGDERLASALARLRG